MWPDRQLAECFDASQRLAERSANTREILHLTKNANGVFPEHGCVYSCPADTPAAQDGQIENDNNRMTMKI